MAGVLRGDSRAMATRLLDSLDHVRERLGHHDAGRTLVLVGRRPVNKHDRVGEHNVVLRHCV